MVNDLQRRGSAANRTRTMDYVSTRGNAPALGFEDVTLAGLASDGGLYVPREWPVLSRDEIAGLATGGHFDPDVAPPAHFVVGCKAIQCTTARGNVLTEP